MTDVMVPFVGEIELGVIGMILLFAFAVVATSNAVNITDGLDGLAGGVMMLAYGAYAVIAMFQGGWELSAFCLTVVGMRHCRDRNISLVWCYGVADSS